MSQFANEHLAKVLQAVTSRPETLEEIKRRYDELNPPIVVVEVSWIRKTILPNTSFRKDPARDFEDAIRALVREGVIKKSITRYLDGPLDKDTEVFCRAQKK